MKIITREFTDLELAFILAELEAARKHRRSALINADSDMYDYEGYKQYQKSMCNKIDEMIEKLKGTEE